jgi:hypothetical protein
VLGELVGLVQHHQLWVLRFITQVAVAAVGPHREQELQVQVEVELRVQQLPQALLVQQIQVAEEEQAALVDKAAQVVLE